MSHIKRKRDRRDYELRRILDQFARMPQRIVTGMPAIPDNYNPAHDLIWAIPDTTEAAPNRAASLIPGGKP